MKVDIVVRNIGELITFKEGPLRRVNTDSAGIIHNAAVAVKDGKVVWVGPDSDADRYETSLIINAEGRIATPGLIDTHTHLIFAGDRSHELWMKLEGRTYSEILEAGGGIYYTVEETRKASLEELVGNALRVLDKMLYHGTTVVEVKTGYGLLYEHEVKLIDAILELKKRAQQTIIGTLLAHVIPKEYMDRRNEYVGCFTRRLVPLAAEKKLEFVDVFCDKGAFTVEETRKIISEGKRNGLKIRLHSDELANIGCSTLALEYEIHSIDHLEYLPESIIPGLATTRTVATLLPTSMLSVFADKKPPVKQLRKNGVYLGAATDYNPNNMNPILQTTLDLAVYLLGLTPLEALAAATVNAAWSLDIYPNHGTIREGAYADILVWDYEKLSQLSYTWGYDRLLTVIAKGNIIRSGL